MKKSVGACLVLLLVLSACARAVPRHGYVIGTGSPPVIEGDPAPRYVIDKGVNDVAFIRSKGAKPINYEEAFALNSAEADHARARGWLALTCDGDEIHPADIPNKTLLDVTEPAAIDWRTSAIADETNSEGYAGTYLDTLRAYTPAGFYDGDPCGWSDADWLSGSIATVQQVKTKTQGKLVIENGRGLGSGKDYFERPEESDRLIAVGDGVQIEFWARAKFDDLDVRYMDRLTAEGKLAFAKCWSTPQECEDLFDRAQRADRRFLHVD